MALGIMNLARRYVRRIRNGVVSLHAWQCNRRVKALNRQLEHTGRPVVFTNWLNHRFWLYPGDNVEFCVRTRSVTDSNNVVRYVMRYVRRGARCVDIGARIGAISVPMWDRVGASGVVISIDADPANIPRLNRNLRLNGFPTKYVVHVAASDRLGVGCLRCYPKAPGWQTLGDGPPFADGFEYYTIDVPTAPVPEILRRYELGAIELVKIDVEGAELRVLRGMRPMLDSRLVKEILFEVNPGTLSGMGVSAQELIDYWAPLNYRVFEVMPDGSRSTCEVRSWNENRIGDCVAVLND